MEGKKNIRRIAIYVLIVLYAVGFVGLQIQWLQATFMLLVPYFLLFSLVVVLLFQVWTPRFVTFLTTIFFAGFCIEMLGVNTGLLFGKYVYGDTLGVQLLHTPLVIGVNWFLMTYGAGVVSNWIPVHWLFRCLSGALMMTGVDALLEPVAMEYDFWQWENQMIPLQNFVAWFAISIIFMVLFHKLHFHKHNHIASILFILLFLFFLAFNIENLFF